MFIPRPRRALGAIFSDGQIDSPVSSVARGEWNAIRKRIIDESDLTSQGTVMARKCSIPSHKPIPRTNLRTTDLSLGRLLNTYGR
jgi:hypothetical protein